MPNSDPTLRQAQFLAGALLAAVVGFAVVIWLLTSGVVSEPGPLAPLPAPVPGVLVLVAALLLIAAPLVERRLMATPAVPASLDPADAGADASAEAPRRYLVSKVVSFALRESAALLGLLVVLVTGEALWGYALCAAAVATMLIAWPRPGDLASRPADLDDPGAGPVEPR